MTYGRQLAALFHYVLFNHLMILKAYAFGSAIGIAGAAALYATIPSYKAFLDWQFAHPLVWLIGLPIGVAIARLTD